LKGAFQSLKESFISYESENYSRANSSFQEAEDLASKAFHQASISALDQVVVYFVNATKYTLATVV
jgi:hypothetical protein